MSAVGNLRVVALSGGVGGARLVHGLARALPAEALTAVVNTGDDFEHWGLRISPDLDTVMYTLADLAHVERGWGLAEESFATLEMMRRYGGEDWFALGDRDLATHLLRTQALGRGEPLGDVTARLCKALGIEAQVLPMCDAPRPTMIDTREGDTLTFQEWFVRRRAAPAVARVWFDGRAEAAPGVRAVLAAAEWIVIAPSNPYVSIDPILTLPGVRDSMNARPGRVVAVSPLVGGKAVKGPLASMIAELTGRAPSSAAIVEHYREAGVPLAGIVVEAGDEGEVAGMDVKVLATRTK